MKKSTMIKLGVMTTIAAQVFATTISADAAINLTGTVVESSAVTLFSDEAEDLTIGSAAVNGTKVGEIKIESNNSAGFDLSVASGGALKFVKAGGNAAVATQHLDYTITLAKTIGALGTNVVEADNLTGINNERTMAFGAAGDNAAPTTVQYEVKLSAAVKALEEGNYADTLTFTIANK